MEANGETAEISEFKTKKKDLEDAVQPIIAKLYASGAGGPPPTGGADADPDSRDEL